MKLSFIIPVYNVEKYLNECVESVFNQGLDEIDFEVLLIDDGSTDTSLEIVNRWVDIHTNVRVFHQENQGQAVARNLGIDNAKGDYLMFVDSDDYLLPNKIAKLLDIIYCQNLDSLIFNLIVQQEDGSNITSSIYGVGYNCTYTGNYIVSHFFVFGSMCRGIFLRKIFKDNSLHFNTGFTHEDSELCFRLYPVLEKVLFVDEEVYFYRYNSQSTDRSISTAKLRRNIESDAIVVAKVLSNLSSYSNEVQQRYKAIAGSIMTSFFLRVKDGKIWQKSEFDNRIGWLRNLKVYPIKGQSSSWKSYFLSKIFNIRPLLKIFLFDI